MAKIFDDSIDFRVYYKDVEHKANLLPAESYIQQYIDSLDDTKPRRIVGLPWEKTNPFFDFRKGEVTMWAGQNGHGKSQVTLQVILSLMGQGEKVALASFELKPVASLARLARLYTGFSPDEKAKSHPDKKEEIKELVYELGGFTKDKLWIYNQTNSVETDRVIGMVRYCAKELKVDHIFVDNLAKCIRNEDDYNGQKFFIDEMMSIAKDNDVHIHVVHHLKKPPKEQERPDKSDVKGSGAIVDQIDNLFLVWRNKAKEDEAKEVYDVNQRKKADEPDSVLYCRKQRNYQGYQEGEPTILLWMHRESGQFLASPNDGLMFFHNYPHRETAF